MSCMVLKARVVQIGNSRAVIIPMFVAKDLGWELGTELELDVVKEELRLTRRKPEKKR